MPRLPIAIATVLMTLAFCASCKPKADNATPSTDNEEATLAPHSAAEDEPPADENAAHPDAHEPEIRLTAPEGGLLGGNGLQDPTAARPEDDDKDTDSDTMELQLKGLGTGGGWRDSTRLRLTP